MSSREYVVGGTYTGIAAGSRRGGAAGGTLEVGYEIGCGIDMSTSNGVSLTGTMGINPSIGLIGTDVISPGPEGVLPGLGGNLGGGVTVGLKPGLVNVVPVTKKEFTRRRTVGDGQQLPRQDRRLRGRVVHPLVCVPDQVDGTCLTPCWPGTA